MKTWKIGAIVGGIWGLLSVLSVTYLTYPYPIAENFLRVIFLPLFLIILPMAFALGGHVGPVFLIIPAMLVGALIGAFVGKGIGNLIGKYKSKNSS